MHARVTEGEHGEKAKINFEEGLEALEALVKQMEGEMPLEASMTAYEEGVKLYAQLCERLEESEKKLKILSGAQEEA